MFYALWVVGVLAAIFVTVAITKKIEQSGKFDE